MKLFLTTMCFCVLELCAQLPDSIATMLSQVPNDQERFEFLDSAANQSLRSNSDLHFLLVNEGLSMAKRVNSDSLYNHFLIKLGTHYVYQDQSDTARILYDKVKQSSTSRFQQAVVLSEIGITYYYESNDKKALEYWVASLKLWEELQDTARIGGITNNIGVIYRYLDDHIASNKYLKKALKYKTLMGATVSAGSTLHNLGVNYSDLEQQDSAMYYLRQAKAVREQYNDIRGLSKTYASLGKVHEIQQVLDSSEYYYRKSIQLDEELNDQVALPTDQFSLADVLFQRGKFKESLLLANKALQTTNDVRVKVDLLGLLGKHYDRNGSFEKASSTKGQLLLLKDSINEAEKKESLQELQVAFDTEQKEAEIAQLSAQNEIQKLKAQQDERTQLILIIVSVALVVIALLLYSRFRSKAKSNAVLDIKNQELAAINKTKDRLFSIISHDLKSPLSSFHLITQSLADNLDGLDKAQIKDYLETLRDSSANVRDMMDNLLKWALTQTNQLSHQVELVDVKGVLDNVIRQLEVVSNAKAINVDIDLSEGVRVEGDSSFLEIILRNLLSNSLKFTPSGKSIHVDSVEDDNATILRVTDEGIGMDQSEIDKLLSGEIIGQEIQNSSEKGTGLGVTLVKELVEKMGGSVAVITEKGRGTTFELHFKKAA